MKYVGRMWHCGVDIFYQRLSDWHYIASSAADESILYHK